MRRLLKVLLGLGLLLGISCTHPHPPHEKRPTPGSDIRSENIPRTCPACESHDVGSPVDATTPEAITPSAATSNPVAVSEPAIRAAVEKSLPVLWQGIEGHRKHRSCFTCHNHGVPMLAFATARQRGFDVPKEDFDELLEFVSDYLDSNRERFLRGRGPGFLGLGGETDTTGWAFFAIEVAGKKPDATTAAMVEYTLQRDKTLDHWSRWGPARPPAEKSIFMATALSIRGLQAYGLPEHREWIGQRVVAAREWLVKTPAGDNEDRVFRLIGLKAAGAQADVIRKAGEELAATQRTDGGWGQTDTMESDAYATGSALVALQMGAAMPVSDPVYRRGLAYLLRTQREDGTWLVRSRSPSVQPYYESGFPHGKNQFISCAATGWAVTALALACPPK